jgi:UDP-N-acetylmuramate--alanine ligase
LQPLAGRTLFFVGIGGAGLSGYALLAKAWGADVSGWDRFETPYLEHVREAGIPVGIADAVTAPPPGAETIVSTAFAGQAAGKPRAELRRSWSGSRTRSSSRARTGRRRRPR